MAGHGIAIRMAEAQAPGVQPDGVIFTHLLTDRAQVSAKSLSAGICCTLLSPARRDVARSGRPASSGDRPEDVVDTAALSRGHVSPSHDGEALRC